MSEITKSMTVFSQLYIKELKQYFFSPMAYIVMCVFLLLAGYFFATPLFLINQASIKGFLDIAPLLMAFTVPAVTMRLFAEEFKSGTYEVLITMPVRDWQVLISKALAAMTLICLTLYLTAVYPLSVAFLGNIDGGALVCAYIGLSLTALLLTCAGVLASSLSKNQVSAFIFGFIIAFAFYFAGKVTPFVPEWIAPVTDFIGLDQHMDGLARGIIDSRDLIYYLTFSAFFLFLAQVKLWVMKED